MMTLLCSLSAQAVKGKINYFALAVLDCSSYDSCTMAKKIKKNKKKNKAAQTLGKLGGLKGGKARAEKLSPEQRSAIARLGGLARWPEKSK
jgi:ABC-type phosphate/phosphonate transport system ATPase subunit